jgi:hypothetical protein
MTYEYRTSTGRYHDPVTGRFVGRAEVLQQTFLEEARLKTRLQGHTRLLLAGKIDLPEWQTRFAQSIKESHLRMSALGAGGKDKLSNAHFGSVGGILRKEYSYLDNFAKGIENGEFSEKYILARAGLYAASTRRSFFKGEQISRAIAGVTLAKRVLDSQSKHCNDCPAYFTPDWTPIENIVVPGEACACGGRCRCTIIYKAAERTTISLSDRLEAILED